MAKIRWEVQTAAWRHRPPKGARGLFIDGGSNLGQGYSFFKRFFPPERFDALLIEPNPYCIPTLEEKFGGIPNVTILQKAIWTKPETLKFFGLVEDHRGRTSSGGSVVETHNSSMYRADKERAIEVEAFSFSELLKEKAEQYPVIVVKMDIESAEYEVLDHLLSEGTITHIDYLIVEFHSQYFDVAHRQRYRALEQQLIQEIKRRGVDFTLWI